MYVCLDLSHVQLFATPWTVAHQAPLSKGTLQERILELVAMSSLQGLFTAQGLNPGLPHCRQILYRWSHQASLPTMIRPACSYQNDLF